MSYRSYDERQPLASTGDRHRPRDALAHAADELSALTQATRRLELYASRIGTAEDGQSLRADIRQCRTDIAKHIKNVASDLAQPVPPSDNARKDGLLQQLQQVHIDRVDHIYHDVARSIARSLVPSCEQARAIVELMLLRYRRSSHNRSEQPNRVFNVSEPRQCHKHTTIKVWMSASTHAIASKT